MKGKENILVRLMFERFFVSMLKSEQDLLLVMPKSIKMHFTDKKVRFGMC